MKLTHKQVKEIAAVIKGRFNSLTALELLDLAIDIAEAIERAADG